MSVEAITKALEEMEAREKAATPGPWGVSDIPGYYTAGEDPEVYHIRKERDDNFFVHARQDLPKLRAALRVALTKLDAIKDAESPKDMYDDAVEGIAQIAAILGDRGSRGQG